MSLSNFWVEYVWTTTRKVPLRRQEPRLQQAIESLQLPSVSTAHRLTLYNHILVSIIWGVLKAGEASLKTLNSTASLHVESLSYSTHVTSSQKKTRRRKRTRKEEEQEQIQGKESRRTETGGSFWKGLVHYVCSFAAVGEPLLWCKCTGRALAQRCKPRGHSVNFSGFVPKELAFSFPATQLAIANITLARLPLLMLVIRVALLWHFIDSSQLRFVPALKLWIVRFQRP